MLDPQSLPYDDSETYNDLPPPKPLPDGWWRKHRTVELIKTAGGPVLAKVSIFGSVDPGVAIRSCARRVLK